MKQNGRFVSYALRVIGVLGGFPFKLSLIELEVAKRLMTSYASGFNAAESGAQSFQIVTRQWRG